MASQDVGRLQSDDNFYVREWNFLFEVIQIGLIIAHFTFQRMIDHVLSGIHFVRVYVDEVMVFRKILLVLWDHLNPVVDRIPRAEWKLKISRCCFALSNVSILGHVTDENGVYMNEDRISKLQEASVPTTIRARQPVLVLAGYYRNFIRNVAETSVALHRATSGSQSLRWTGKMLNVFHAVYRNISEPPVMSIPDIEKPFIMETDASDVSLEAVFYQKKDDGKI